MKVEHSTPKKKKKVLKTFGAKDDSIREILALLTQKASQFLVKMINMPKKTPNNTSNSFQVDGSLKFNHMVIVS